MTVYPLFCGKSTCAVQLEICGGVEPGGYPPGTPTFCLAFFRLCSVGVTEQPGLFVSRLVRWRRTAPETLSLQTLPYDLPYICPVIRPRPRWTC